MVIYDTPVRNPSRESFPGSEASRKYHRDEDYGQYLCLPKSRPSMPLQHRHTMNSLHKTRRSAGRGGVTSRQNNHVHQIYPQTLIALFAARVSREMRNPVDRLALRVVQRDMDTLPVKHPRSSLALLQAESASARPSPFAAPSSMADLRLV